MADKEAIASTLENCGYIQAHTGDYGPFAQDLAEHFRILVAERERLKAEVSEFQGSYSDCAEDRDRLKGFLTDLWGTICPDAGPEDFPRCLQEVEKIVAAHANDQAEIDRLTNNNAELLATLKRIAWEEWGSSKNDTVGQMRHLARQTLAESKP